MIIQFLESKSVLEAKFSSAYNSSIGAFKYVNILKNYSPSNFENFPKLCITFKNTMKNYLKCKHVQIWVLLLSVLVQTFLAKIIYEKTQTDI